MNATTTIADSQRYARCVESSKRVRWDISINLAVAWVLTIPASALVAFAAYMASEQIF